MVRKLEVKAVNEYETERNERELEVRSWEES